MTEWDWQPLGEVCRTGAGGTPLKAKREFYENGEIPWLLSGEVGQRDILQASQRITKLGLQNSSAKIFPNNTVLIAMYGATAGEVGVLKFSSSTNQAVCGIYPSDELLPDFIYYFFLHAKERLVETATGNAQPNISQTKIRATRIPVPPLAEQRRIVEILDEAFAGIVAATANSEKNLANAQELLAATLNDLISSDEAGTRECSLREVCVVDWGNTDLTKKSYEGDGRFLAVSAAGCDGRIGHKEHTAFTPVLSAIGARCGRMFLPNEDFTAIKNTITLTPRPGEVDGRFLYYLLTSIELPKRGAAQPFIAKGDIQKFMVQVPTRTEQIEIVSALDQMKQATADLECLYHKRLDAMSELKQSILGLAFSGGLLASEQAVAA